MRDYEVSFYLPYKMGLVGMEVVNIVTEDANTRRLRLIDAVTAPKIDIAVSKIKSNLVEFVQRKYNFKITSDDLVYLEIKVL